MSLACPFLNASNGFGRGSGNGFGGVNGVNSEAFSNGFIEAILNTISFSTPGDGCEYNISFVAGTAAAEGDGFDNPFESNPVHPNGSIGLGDFIGGGRPISNEEFVLVGLLALSKLSPLILCCPAFKFVELLDPKLGLR